jgi:hypothetical protein
LSEPKSEPSGEHRGGCHCGNLRLSLRLSQAPASRRAAARLRLFVLPRPQHAYDQRSRRGGGHPRRRLVPGRVLPLWHGTAEFCKRCGVYIGAIGETASGTRAVINTNCLEDRAAFTQQPQPVDHDGEAIDDSSGPTRRQLDAGDASPGITETGNAPAQNDDWISFAVTDKRPLCAIVPGLAAFAQFGSAQRTDTAAAQRLPRAGVPAAALVTSRDLVLRPSASDRLVGGNGDGVLPVCHGTPATSTHVS